MREFEYHPDRHQDATPEYRNLMSTKLGQAREAADWMGGFSDVCWGVWADYEAFRCG